RDTVLGDFIDLCPGVGRARRSVPRIHLCRRLHAYQLAANRPECGMDRPEDTSAAEHGRTESIQFTTLNIQPWKTGSIELMHQKCPIAKLALEDGTAYIGQSFGATGEVCGEVCLNPSMTGCQEFLTDPSYRGQSVTTPYPLLRNYGA